MFILFRLLAELMFIWLLWVTVGLYEFLWVTMGFCELLWVFMGYMSYMSFYGLNELL